MNNLWAITSYFNPQRYRRRLENYHTFRRHLRLPLVVVELALGGPPELCPADAEILVQLTDGDVMWQKERLLNVALKHLPPECDKVVWLDADIVVADAGWPDRIAAALDHWDAVQAYSTVDLLGPDGFDTPSPIRQRSFLAALAGGQTLADCAERLRQHRIHDLGIGLAWAARRDLLEAHGWYDACIIGAGDTAWMFAALDRADVVVDMQALNDRQCEYYRAWAAPFAGRVRGRVGWIPGHVEHLWHGAVADRRHGKRHADLAPHDFDPAADIVHDGGAWKWNSDKPHLHQLLKDYFAGRREDQVSA